MNLITANDTDVIRNFTEYLNRVAYAGESFIIVRGGRALAESEKESFRADLTKMRKSVAYRKQK